MKRGPSAAHPSQGDLGHKKRRRTESPSPPTRKKTKKEKKKKENVAAQQEDWSINNYAKEEKKKKCRTGGGLTKEARRLLKEADRALRRRSAIHRLRLQPCDKQLTTFHPPHEHDHHGAVDTTEEAEGAASSLGLLHLGWVCYVCKKRYTQVHFFYDQLCPWCATLNYAKRIDRANLAGRVALVTGGRVKIGFQCALRLLRCGASVLVTTRFPTDAALRYSAERDFGLWKDRLHIYGLDLRGMGMVQLFTQFIAHTHPRLDIIINNAAQTIRRPPAYYAHLLPAEATPADRLPGGVRSLLANRWNQENAVDLSHFQRALQTASSCSSSSSLLSSPTLLLLPPLNDTSSSSSSSSLSDGPQAGAVSSASALSQVRLVAGEDDAEAGGALFPARALDADGQQVDMRPANTWSARAHEVSGVEVMEVHTINAVAPYIITSQLLPLMLAHSPGLDKYVVNVSSMEGKFTRPHKDHRHPHTNMAKAALNMMTCTMAADYARDNVFINSVDTGWVTNEHAWGKEGWDDFTPPLDDIDGAARILQPIFDGVARRNFMSGLFLKDYSATSW